MTDPSADPQRVEQIRSDLAGAYGLLSDVNKKLARHTVLHAQHTATLAEHTVLHAQHTATLAEHTVLHAQHTTTLAEHTVKLDRVLEILEAS